MIYQTYMRETIAIVQQQRERMPSPFNDLACRPSDQEYRDWTTKRQMMLPNYSLDQITLLRHSRKSTFYSSTETESCPVWTWLTLTTPDISCNHLEKFFFATIARLSPRMRTRKCTLGTWQSVHCTGTSTQ